MHALGRVRLAGDRVEHFAVAELGAAVAQRGAQVFVGLFLRSSNGRRASVSSARAVALTRCSPASAAPDLV